MGKFGSGPDLTSQRGSHAPLVGVTEEWKSEQGTPVWRARPASGKVQRLENWDLVSVDLIKSARSFCSKFKWLSLVKIAYSLEWEIGWEGVQLQKKKSQNRSSQCTFIILFQVVWISNNQTYTPSNTNSIILINFSNESSVDITAPLEELQWSLSYMEVGGSPPRKELGNALFESHDPRALIWALGSVISKPLNVYIIILEQGPFWFPCWLLVKS